MKAIVIAAILSCAYAGIIHHHQQAHDAHAYDYHIQHLQPLHYEHHEQLIGHQDGLHGHYEHHEQLIGHHDGLQGHYQELHGHHVNNEDHHDEAHYSFKYEVNAPKTGDFKTHEETRDGDKVKGHYSVVESDGHKRIVHYTADKHSGFVAHVTRVPTHHQVPEPVHHHYGHDEHATSYVHVHTPQHSYHH